MPFRTSSINESVDDNISMSSSRYASISTRADSLPASAMSEVDVEISNSSRGMEMRLLLQSQN